MARTALRAALAAVFPVFVACASPAVTDASFESDHVTKNAKPGHATTDDDTPTTTNGSTPAAPTTPTTPAACGGEPSAVVDTATVDPFMTTQMKAAGFPGMSVAVIGGGRLKWATGYGLANVEENKAATADTLFMIASISKAVTAVALMQLIEDPARGLALDQDVNAHLPFTVRNPKFPNTPITYRMLLTHTSGLIDSQNGYWDIEEPTPLNMGDSPIVLGDFLRGYVARTDSWASSKPAGKYSYSNTGASLLGLLVERISGASLQDYTKENIFDRIGMTESSWFLRGLDPTHIAMPYDLARKPIGQYGYPNYPAGQLRTSATQLARFLLAFQQKGNCGGRVLEEATIKDMMTEQFTNVETDQGLIWYYETIGGTRVFGHNGEDQGMSSDMYFDPATGTGYVLLANGAARSDDDAAKAGAMASIGSKLMELAKTIP